MNFYVTFIASDAEDGPLANSNQPHELTLGPFPDYIQLTYKFLRVGPEGDHIAVYNDGYWQVEAKLLKQGLKEAFHIDKDGPLFSDVVIDTDAVGA